jgi:hypothetical protein
MFRADFNPNNRIVKQEHFEFEGNKYFISTVDLGLDHSFGGGSPLYFETMIFPDGKYELYCERYSTREESLEAHEKLMEDIKEGKYEIVDSYFQLKEDEK